MTAALAEQLGDDDPDAIIGATVRALVSAHRADTGALARAMGISRNSYYNRINGEKAWHARDVYRAASFFGCSIQDIYDGTVRISPRGIGAVTGVDTERYPTPTAGLAPVIPLVSDPSARYRGVPAGYGSSAPSITYSDDRSGCHSSGEVHNANAA